MHELPRPDSRSAADTPDRPGWVVFPLVETRRDPHGVLRLIEDPEHIVAISLAEDVACAPTIVLSESAQLPSGGTRSRSGAAAALPAVVPHRMDEPAYPSRLAAAARGSVLDVFGYPNRTCESFAAHWIRVHGGVDLRDHGGAAAWLRAGHWHIEAQRRGATVGSEPRVGSLAQTDQGFGHVAVVVAVSGKSVTLEDYDYGLAGEFRSRSLPSVGWRFIDVRSLAATEF